MTAPNLDLAALETLPSTHVEGTTTGEVKLELHQPAAGGEWAVLCLASAGFASPEVGHGWVKLATPLRITARRIAAVRDPLVSPAPPAPHPVELVLTLAHEHAHDDPNGKEEKERQVCLPILPREVTDLPPSAAAAVEEEVQNEKGSDHSDGDGGSDDGGRWWACCQITTHALTLHPLRTNWKSPDGTYTGPLLLAFANTQDASHLMDYIFYLHTMAPPQTNNNTADGEEEEEEEEEGDENGEEAQEREDYDEKYTFTQPEYWECFHKETDEECFEWYSAEELQRHSILRGFSAFFRPALSALPPSSPAPPVYRVLDIGAGTSELLFNLYEALSIESHRGNRPFRIELWAVDFSRTAVEFLRGQKWARHAQMRARCPALDDEGHIKGGWPGVEVFQRVMDATDLSFFPDQYFDMVTEKGCLDCFVNGTGRTRVPSYFQQIKRVLRLDGHLLMITVTNIDVALILQTGGEVAQRAVVRKTAATPQLTPEEQLAARQLHHLAPGRFVVEEIRAKVERHALLCRPACAKDGAEAGLEAEKTVVCDECERRYLATALPKRCGRCSNLLQRFIVG